MAMEVVFWGVRGSMACCSSQHRRYGGHTSCVSVKCDDRLIILDAGTGLYDLGLWIREEKIKRADLLLTHFHFDHIIGLPFFPSVWDPDFHLTIHAVYQDDTPERLRLENFLRRYLFAAPFFPVSLDITQAHIKLKDHAMRVPFSLAPDIHVKSQTLNHPGGATGYRINYQGKSISYITDTEHVADLTDPHVLELMQQADLVIYDATYTEAEFPDKIGWGHSTWQEGVRLAKIADVKKLVLSHHDPGHTDAVLDVIEQQAQAVWSRCLVARQGMKMTL